MFPHRAENIILPRNKEQNTIIMKRHQRAATAIATIAATAICATSCITKNEVNAGGEDPFADATFCVLGDSYSTFKGAVTPDTNFVWYDSAQVKRGGTDVCKLEQMWWHIMADSLGMRLMQNNAFSGSTVGYHGYDDNKDGQSDDYSDRAFITRQPNLVKSDYIFVFGGTNDSWSGAPAGTYDYETFSRDSLYTFRPAMAKLLRDLKESQPQAKIIVLINSQLRYEISESMQAIADHYGVPYVVLYDIDKHWGHPTIAGQRAIAEQVVRALERTE